MNWDLIKLKLSGFRISVRLIERIVIGSFYVGCVFLGLMFVAWQYFQPFFHRLEMKDPFRYDQITKDFANLYWISAYQEIRELEAISQMQLYWEGYERFQKQFAEDERFHKETLKKRERELEQTREARKIEHQKQIHKIEYWIRPPSQVPSDLSEQPQT